MCLFDKLCRVRYGMLNVILYDGHALRKLILIYKFN